MTPLERFNPLTRSWFEGTFAAPTPAQAQAWSAVADGEHTLVIAPTGSGKTLAAFLWAIDQLAHSEGAGTRSRRRHGERAIWQRRFWEHTCRDEEDVKRCVDYIHWNPVKHGLVSHVRDYPWSSFHRYVQLGEYSEDWGRKDPCPTFDMPE